MALVPANGQPPVLDQPTQALWQALSDFESMLTIDERQRLHSGSSVPGLSNVLDFVGQIDSNNRTRGGLCVAQRLCKFLDSIQQFTKIVDTFVQSNPATAALVWGSVRMTILVASNVASFFDKVTNMIMRIGNLSPIFRQFGALYPGHVGIQGALCNYYAIVMRICIRILEVSRRTSVMQVMSSVFVPFEAEFNGLLEDLKQASKLINLQVSLASKEQTQRMAYYQQKDHKQNQFYQKVALKFHEDSRRQYDEARQWRLQQRERETNRLKTSIKDNLSTIDYLKPWKQAIRQTVPGTAQWIPDEAVFEQWRNTSSSANLWCSGKLGSGKTVLASHVISHLHVTRRSDEVVALYFCRKEDEASLFPRNIIGSLARQILDSHIEQLEMDDLGRMDADSKGLGAEELANLLMRRMTEKKQYYIVIDGLDECDDVSIKSVVNCLANMLSFNSPTVIKLLFTGRAELENQLSFRLDLHHKITLTKKRVSDDIEIALETMIQQKIASGDLKLQDKSLERQIGQRLHQESDGIFLWVVLVLEEICSRNSDYDILDALDHLPRGLSQLLNKKVERIRQHNEATAAMKLLEYTAVVKRPLTITEIQEALSIELEQISLDSRKFINDMNSVVGACRGLLFVDEEESTIHYIHQSVQAYLFTRKKSPLGHANLREANLYFGQLCMTYLRFSNFGRQIAKVKKPPRTNNDALEIGLAALKQKKSVSNHLAQKLLLRHRKSQGPPAVSVEGSIQEVVASAELDRLTSEIARQYNFLAYAKRYWYQHLPSLEQHRRHQKIWNLFTKIIEATDTPAERPWITDAANRTSMLPYQAEATMLKWAVENDHSAALRYIWIRCWEIVGRAVCLSIFMQAIKCGSAEIMNVLTRISLLGKFSGDLNDLGFRFDRETDLGNALTYFASRGQIPETVNAIELGASINAKFTPTVFFSAETIDDNIAETWSASWPELDRYRYKSHDLVGYSPLSAAVEGDHSDIVSILLELGAEPNLQGQLISSESEVYGPLHTAVATGRIDQVETLLAAGADPNMPSASGRSVKSMVKSDHEILTILKRADHNPNFYIKGTDTPLISAMKKRDYNEIKILLEAGATPNFCKDGLDVPLHLAIRLNNKYLVNLMLDAGADSNIKGNASMPALHYAICNDRYEMAGLLINAGADVDLYADEIDPPIFYAVRQKTTIILEALIEAGADLNIRINHDQHTALQEALWMNQPTMVNALIMAGAEMHPGDVMRLIEMTGPVPPQMHLKGRLPKIDKKDFEGLEVPNFKDSFST